MLFFRFETMAKYSGQFNIDNQFPILSNQVETQVKKKKKS